MNGRAQSSLEYLLTYGWALILIASLISALAFVVISPSQDTTFSISDTTKILLKGGTFSGGVAEIKLQNITGGKIEITGTALSGGYSGASCELNGKLIASGPVSIEVAAGSEMSIQCSGVSGGGSGKISIDYTDFAGLLRTAVITATVGGTKLLSESDCANGIDDDGDGTTDCDDSDCFSNPACFLFFDDMESGPGSWVTFTGILPWLLLHDSQTCSNSNSPSHSWYYGQVPQCNYDYYVAAIPTPNFGVLDSPQIDLTGVSGAILYYSYWMETEHGASPCLLPFDALYLQIFVPGSGWQDLERLCGAEGEWHNESYDLSPYTGNLVQIRFYFDTDDHLLNAYRGIYVDDVRVVRTS